MKTARLSIVASTMLSLFASATAQANQSTVDRISQFGPNYTISDNHAALNDVDCAWLGADWASCNKAVVTLTNPARPSLTKTGPFTSIAFVGFWM